MYSFELLIQRLRKTKDRRLSWTSQVPYFTDEFYENYPIFKSLGKLVGEKTNVFIKMIFCDF